MISILDPTALDAAAERRSSVPTLLRGLAADWPAVRHWSFAGLAGAVPDLPARLVMGNREQDDTQFVQSSLRTYLHALQADPASEASGYLKEFDLLGLSPPLRKDLDFPSLLPSNARVSMQSWVGPAGARTGAHFDHLDNVAVQILGTKRWLLARPGTVERMGAVSSKYDPWATLAATGLEALAAQSSTPGDFLIADVGPGDVLYLPAGWWHEVRNLTAGLLFGGFHAKPLPLLLRWAWVGARHKAHQWGGYRRGHCVCHPAKPMSPHDGRHRMHDWQSGTDSLLGRSGH
jgi:hypothetical protein